MEPEESYENSDACSPRPDAIWANESREDPTRAGPVHAHDPAASDLPSDAESVGCPQPPLQPPRGGAQPPVPAAGCTAGTVPLAQADALLSDAHIRTLLSQVLVQYCLVPSSRVGDHPATLAMGVVVQSAFHGVEPPREWVGAVCQLPPQVFMRDGMVEMRRAVRRAVGEWRRCSPDTTAAARCKAGICNLLAVRDAVRNELGRRHPTWMGGLWVACWGATPSEWDARASLQGWLTDRLELTGGQVEALRAALAEFRAGAGGGAAAAALPRSPGDAPLAAVAAGDPGAVERYFRLMAAYMAAVTWRQRVATAITMTSSCGAREDPGSGVSACEFVTLCEALVAKGPTLGAENVAA